MKRTGLYVMIIMASAAIMLVNHSFAKEPEVFKLGLMTSFTGPFSAVAETQKKGVLLKVEEINKKGGLNMPWGKVKIEPIIKDDKLDVDTGVKLFGELADIGIHALIGGVFVPIASAINEECKKTGIPFLPSCVPAFDSFKKGNPAQGTFSVAFTPWSIGYLTGGTVIKTLGKKKIYFVSRSDSWGSTILEGLKKACETFGGEVVGVSTTPKGTTDYKAIIEKAKAANPDVFITCMFGSDAVNNLKQAYEMGLNKSALIFNTWITNVVAMGIPEDALAELYALEYFYYDLEYFEDQELAKRAKAFTDAHVAMWKEPPDAYGTIAYTAADILFQAVEKAKSFDNKKISEVLASSHFSTVKGDVHFREDHQMVSKYMAFLVQGKEGDDKENKFDVFDVVGYFGGEKSLPSLQDLGY